MSDPTPEERAEKLFTQMLGRPVFGIALRTALVEVIREAERAALERAANLCDEFAQAAAAQARDRHADGDDWATLRAEARQVAFARAAESIRADAARALASKEVSGG